MQVSPGCRRVPCSSPTARRTLGAGGRCAMSSMRVCRVRPALPAEQGTEPCALLRAESWFFSGSVRGVPHPLKWDGPQACGKSARPSSNLASHKLVQNIVPFGPCVATSGTSRIAKAAFGVLFCSITTAGPYRLLRGPSERGLPGGNARGATRDGSRDPRRRQTRASRGGSRRSRR